MKGPRNPNNLFWRFVGPRAVAGKRGITESQSLAQLVDAKSAKNPQKEAKGNTIPRASAQENLLKGCGQRKATASCASFASAAPQEENAHASQ